MGENIVLMTQDLFEEFVKLSAEKQNVGLHIDYGKPVVFDADFIHEHNIYAPDVRKVENDDQPPE